VKAQKDFELFFFFPFQKMLFLERGFYCHIFGGFLCGEKNFLFVRGG